MKKISFLDINVNSITKEEIVNVLLDFSKEKCPKPKTAFYLNAHCVNIAYSDYQYRSILNNSDLVYAGGQGVVWAAKLLGIPLPERVNILDFFNLLAERLKTEKRTIYLLGERSEVVKKAGEVLKNRGLKIVGSRDGFFEAREESEIIREINILEPNILMVGMGVPKQEKWINNHLNELNVNLCWAVGGVFKILSGEFKKTPNWVRDIGLEWLYLGLQDPNRLLKRYLLGNFIFSLRVLKCGGKMSDKSWKRSLN